MIHLPKIRLWKVISLVLASAGVIFALIGTFCVEGNLAVHWGGDGTPNGFAGKPVLWFMAVLSVLSMFSYESFAKERPGWHFPMGGPETAYAFSTWLTGGFAAVNVIAVLYSFYPAAVIPTVGAIGIVALLPALLLIAHLRNKRSEEKYG